MYNSPKRNIRSFRFSDEVAAVLEGYEGKSLNDKFENLVLFCYHKLEQRQKDLDNINQEIQEARDRLTRLQKATEELRMLEKDIKSAQFYFGIVERRAKTIAEAAEKDDL